MKESLKVLKECAYMQEQKSQDYQSDTSNVLQAMHYRRGLDTIHDIIIGKVTRATSLLESGKDPNVSVAAGIAQSFLDAPGGIGEEFNELNFAVGAEYWYDKQFALRAGYFYENPNKGNRNHLTMGLGLKYNIFNLDFSYLVPLSQRNPLENTLRFTMSFDFADIKTKTEETTD